MASMPRGYSANHHRVYRHRGAASGHGCARCTKQATQWAHIHDCDPAVPSNYMPLCRSCHAKYDGAAPPTRTGLKPSNAAFTDEQAEQIRALVRSGVSQAEVARRMGCIKQVVWRIVHGVAYARGVPDG